MKPKQDSVDNVWPRMNPPSVSSSSERQHLADNIATNRLEATDPMMATTNVSASRSRNKPQSSFTIATPMFNRTLGQELVSVFGHPLPSACDPA